MPTETRSPERSFEEYLNLEQAEVARSGRLGAMHWLIVGTSFLITLLAWYGSQYIVTERASQRFEREADQIVERVTERLQRYEDALWAAAAAVEANDGVGTLQGWRNYTRRLDLAGRYPNVQALNVLYKVEPEELAEFVATQRLQRPDFSIRSQNKGDLHLIVTYASPELGNEKAIGFDTAHDPGRRDTLMRAAKLNEAQLTQPLVLVQDETQTTSILMAVPFYGGGQDPVPLNRSRRLEGLIAMPLMMNRVVNGVLGDDSQAHSLRITDGDAVIQDIDNTDMEQRQDRSAAISGAWDQSPEVTGESGLDERGQFRLERVVDVYGRQWKFDVSSSNRFSSDAGYLFPTAVLVGGLFVDILLLGMFLLLARANKRALSLAQRTAGQLCVKAEALVATNRELESFAYVVSHDLKTPLRGIQDLADYIEEDLEDVFESGDAHREVRRNLGRIGQQVRRSNALIEGILDYSGVGMREEQIIEVDVARMIEEIAEALPILPAQLVTRGRMPVFDTYGIRLAQVLGNLINNAFKYHHDPQNALVVVDVTEHESWYRFSIRDDGPGIDQRFHHRVFEVFKTLQSRDAIESTGVGLSIVKKSVELLGGKVWIESTPGAGTTMLFEWPKSIQKDEQQARRVA